MHKIIALDLLMYYSQCLCLSTHRMVWEMREGVPLWGDSGIGGHGQDLACGLLQVSVSSVVLLEAPVQALSEQALSEQALSEILCLIWANVFLSSLCFWKQSKDNYLYNRSVKDKSIASFKKWRELQYLKGWLPCGSTWPMMTLQLHTYAWWLISEPCMEFSNGTALTMLLSAYSTFSMTALIHCSVSIVTVKVSVQVFNMPFFLWTISFFPCCSIWQMHFWRKV